MKSFALSLTLVPKDPTAFFGFPALAVRAADGCIVLAWAVSRWLDIVFGSFESGFVVVTGLVSDFVVIRACDPDLPAC